jgi:hypothetical protein
VIVTYLRSSSYTSWDFCEHKTFLAYIINLHDPANQAADKGTITHKALELLASYKLATQQGNDTFQNDEVSGVFDVNNFTPDTAIEVAFRHFSEKHAEYVWTAHDLKDCQSLMYKALNWKDGLFSPLKREIVSPEQKFDFKINQSWAEYDYGDNLKGRLSLRGTLDLIVQADGNCLEIIDWKTGRPYYDWGKGRDKSYEDFMMDPQLRLYHYAACRLYPDVDDIFVTIFYLKDGPVSLCFSRDDALATEEMIRLRFEEMRDCQVPNRVWPDRKCNWCHFSKHDVENNKVEDYKESSCYKLHKEVVSLGIDRVTQKYGKENVYVGGGRYKQGENNNG